jgi:hypothetical protein
VIGRHPFVQTRRQQHRRLSVHGHEAGGHALFDATATPKVQTEVRFVARKSDRLLESGGYDGIIRYSQPILASGQYTEVIAITPAAIGKLGVSSVYALGQATRQLIVTRPDGSTFVPEILS